MFKVSNLPQNDITVFAFDSSAVRTKCVDGSVYICARDLASAIGHSNVTDMQSIAKESEIRNFLIPNARGEIRETPFVSESGLYRILFRSSLPKCEPFQDFLAKEVLPSIRRTGSYNTNTLESAPMLHIDMLRSAALAFGLSQNQASLAADYAVKKLTNGAIKPLELLGIEIKEDEKDRLLTPTEIAQELNNPTYPSAKSVNILLAANGYQVKLESKQWQATEKGKQFCEVISVNKSHNSGAPVTQLKWRFAIVEKLKTFIEDSSAFDF